MEVYLTFFLMILATCMSPGACSAVILGYSLKAGRLQAIRAGAGITVSLMLQGLLGLVCMRYVLATWPSFIPVVQLLGGLYFSYYGTCLILQSLKPKKIEGANLKQRPFLEGFMVNLVNPQSILFLLSAFDTACAYGRGLWVSSLFLALIAAASMGWFSLFSIILTNERLSYYFKKYQKPLLVASGSFVAFLGPLMIFKFIDFCRV